MDKVGRRNYADNNRGAADPVGLSARTFAAVGAAITSGAAHKRMTELYGLRSALCTRARCDFCGRALRFAARAPRTSWARAILATLLLLGGI
jgi:hypothetical protein